MSRERGGLVHAMNSGIPASVPFKPRLRQQAGECMKLAGQWPVSCTVVVRHGSCPRLYLTTEPEETQVLCARNCTRLGSVENKSDPGHALREPSPRAPPSRSSCSRNRHWPFCALSALL